MKNIPLFTTSFGVASLVLEKVPYTAQAYIVLQETWDLDKLLAECAQFCSAAGADSICATGNEDLEKFPVDTQIISMKRPLEGLPQTDATLFPVEEKMISAWRETYNEKMRNVPNAAFLSIRDTQRLVEAGKCYFVHRGSSVLGIGVVGDDSIDAVAASIPGAGTDVLLALCSSLTGQTVSLEVASNNAAAMKLYRKLGFLESGVVSTWHKIK